MAKIPLPDRGQPLDVTYLYQITSAVNDLADSISTATGKYATIDSRVAGKQNFKIPDIRLFAGYVDVANAVNVSPETTIEKSVDFGAAFKYPPIVIPGVVNNNTQSAGNDTAVVVSSVTTTSASFRIKFNISGEVSVGVNYIAIGVPA